MNHLLRSELLAMQKEDVSVREELLFAGLLGDGYNPPMEAVHRKNASRLREIVREYGWPGRALVGDGAEAACLILQHAIGEPDLLRGCLPLLQRAAEQNDIPAWQPAYLIDRICFYERRPQIYGTQSDWNDSGVMEVWKLQDEERVHELRRGVGLPPLGASMNNESEPPMPRDKVLMHRRNMDAWARRVGWRT
jgi:hypothetical protein